jgi:hypothetical protein
MRTESEGYLGKCEGGLVALDEPSRVRMEPTSYRADASIIACTVYQL